MRWAVLAALGLAAAALGGACSARPATPFAHKLHLAGLECGQPGKPDCLTCDSCHRRDADAGAFTDFNRPTETLCASCHQQQGGGYRLASSVRSPLSPRPAALDIRFDHDRHLAHEKIRGQCVKCHPGVVGASSDKALFPNMDSCLGCHEHRDEFAQNVCATCHRPADLRGLRPVSFLAHDNGWIRRHAVHARGGEQACATCHAQTRCDACHDATHTLRAELRSPEAIDRDLVHRFDFISRHATEASSQPALCAACHQRQDCDGCHVRRGVSGGRVDARNPHPLRWAAGADPTNNLHGRDARRDLAACAACHDQGPATNCVRCHKVGGIGGTPHPPGWRSTQQPGSGACATCHGGGP